MRDAELAEGAGRELGAEEPAAGRAEGLDQLAAAPDAVTRQVAADVDALAQARQGARARLGDGQQRAGLGVALAEAQRLGEELGDPEQDVLVVAEEARIDDRQPRARREQGRDPRRPRLDRLGCAAAGNALSQKLLIER